MDHCIEQEKNKLQVLVAEGVPEYFPDFRAMGLSHLGPKDCHSNHSQEWRNLSLRPFLKLHPLLLQAWES